MSDTPQLCQDIFSSLGKYCTDQWEHYAVEAFTFVLNLLLLTDRNIAVEILNRLTSTDEFAFNNNDDIKIVAQLPAGASGTPDITVQCADKLVFIESKVESPVDLEQLQKYQLFLESSGIQLHKLVLLTKYYANLDKALKKQIKEVRWDDIKQWLKEAEIKIRHAISKFMLNSFTNFLKEGGISMERVSSDYVMLRYALPQLNNLLNIFDTITKEIGGTSVTIGTKPWGWTGFYYRPSKSWFSVYFTSPMDFTFEIWPLNMYDFAKIGTNLRNQLPAELKKYQQHKEGDYAHIYWNLEEHGFFSMMFDEQLGMTRTLATICQQVEKMSQKKTK